MELYEIYEIFEKDAPAIFFRIETWEPKYQTM